MIDCDPVLNGNIIGVFAADKLPMQLPSTPFGFIANTDIHTKPGKHWCAFFSNKQGHFDFFDTYGKTPLQNSPYFEKWLKIKSRSVKTSSLQIQSDNSAVCGFYCILFLHERLNGSTFLNFMNTFDTSALESNDQFIIDTRSNAFFECAGNGFAFQICTSNNNCF